MNCSGKTKNGIIFESFGYTDLFLAFDDQYPGYNTIDCAKVHIDAIAQQASEK